MKIYRAIETPITFQDSGGSAVITLSNLAGGSSRHSARYNRGDGDLPSRYQWRAVFQFATAPNTAGCVRLYLSECDNNGHADGHLSASDSASSEVQLSNLHNFGCVSIQYATANADHVASGIIEIWDRYFAIGVWNRGGAALRNSSNTSKIILTPIPWEIQS